MSDTEFERDDIKEAYVLTGSSGDIASGTIRLTYEGQDTEEKLYEISYDTKPGPDGLETLVDASVGEDVRNRETGQVLPVTEFVHEQASETLRHYYSAVKQGGEERGSVVFTDIQGLDDGWLPE